MQTSIHGVTVASEVIQLAIAPVFLLMGVGTLLSVLTGRLGRVMDRFRVLNEGLFTMQASDTRQVSYHEEIDTLLCRANWVHWSITLCTFTLLLVAVVIGLLFLGSAISWDSAWLVSTLFIFSMASLILGLICFLREISLSKHMFQLSNRNAAP